MNLLSFKSIIEFFKDIWNGWPFYRYKYTKNAGLTPRQVGQMISGFKKIPDNQVAKASL